MTSERAKDRKPRVNQKAIAEQAGVSVPTVSRVLNQVGGVREDLRQRVLAAAAALNYEIRPRQKELRRVTLLKVRADMFQDAFYGGIMTGVETECQNLGAKINYLVVDPTNAQSLDLIRKEMPDGLILMAVDDQEWVAEILSLDIPAVMINAEPGMLPIDAFLPDNHTGPRLAVEHLLDHGHRRIAYFNFSQRPTLQLRFDSYRNALENAGIAYDPSIVLDNREGYSHHIGGTYEFMRHHLQDHRLDFTAMICCTDLAAMATIRALQEAGYRVPEDISIVGYDDLPTSAYIVPPLTTIRIEREQLGALAIERLAKRVANPDLTPIRVELATRLIERQSVMWMDVE